MTAMNRARRTRTGIAATCVALTLAGAEAGAEPYRLAPQDAVRLRVVEWRDDLRGVTAWEALGGEYVVDQDGALRLPLIGAIPAADRSIAELAAAIETALQLDLGLADRPSAAMEIARYRPFYVLGDVDAPGAYPFAPGLTALQALALAGGAPRLSGETARDLRVTLTDRGALELVALDTARLRARRARLSAEFEDAESPVFPSDLIHPEGAEATARLIEGETMIFGSRREAHARALGALDDLRALLEAEIRAGEANLAALARQIGDVQVALGNMESLLEKGLARSPSVLNLQGMLLDLERRRLEVETGLFRARQRVAETQRDAEDLRGGRLTLITTELQETDAALERLASRQRQLLGFLAESGAAAALGLGAAVALEPVFEIVRRSPDGVSRVLTTAPNAALQPADVLRVRILPVAEGDAGEGAAFGDPVAGDPVVGG